MSTFYITITISVVVSLVFFFFQFHYFLETKRCREKFENFFKRNESYSTRIEGTKKNPYPQINYVCQQDTDLYELIEGINRYLFKTKGTSDYEFIRKKVERKLDMRYDQSTVHIAFPTYLGLMGTFLGVFMGILSFLLGFDGANNITDESIKNLLIGVLVSMLTSLCGLVLTTINNHSAGEARKKIEDDKDEFYDFIQTEVTKTASASLVSAISKLHDTVDKFEPAFDGVINRFQNTFDRCTKAFGDNFEKNVVVVSEAVKTMGENMDKINANIDLQHKLLENLKSDDLVRGMDKYVEAAEHFVGITKSLDKFEEARRLMLAAAQESIAIQNRYNESLKIPREVAIKISQILDRVSDFEKNINETAQALTRREILGNDVITMIKNQISGISKKGKIADQYLGIADGKLEDLYKEQTKAIDEMNKRYKAAIEGHIQGFEEMLSEQTKAVQDKHKAFISELQNIINIEEVHSDFSNLRKLNEIVSQLQSISKDSVKSDVLNNKLKELADALARVEKAAANHGNNDVEKKIAGFFGIGRK